ncbi:MAG: glycosyl hydrolase family 25 [Quinella sp. 3Q1]|nr:glycosyl hydrolase family 25 [Quinella sp. 3Q1]
MKGIDVSIYNDFIDWRAVKDAGIDFAICRTGYGKSGFDDSFQRNVHDAHDAGLICGAYHYSYALTPQDAITEALFCKRIIHEAGVLLELPVFFDMEDADGYKARHGFRFTRQNITDICAAFLDAIKPLNCGVYASLSLGSRDDLRGYLWQFTDRLKIGNQFFDANILYD